MGSTPLRFNLTLPRFIDEGTRVPYRRTYEFAQHVEALGFHGGFVGHHSFTPETKDPAAPFVLLTAIAAQTDRLRLGTGVYLGALHHPIASHEQASTLDQISGGRLMLGVGTGYRDYEFSNFQVPMRTRGKRLNETLALWKKAWTTGSWEWDGDFFHFTDVSVYPPSVQTPHPPIYIGGNSAAAIDRAAKHGDMWFTLPMETLDVVIEMCAAYRAACAKYGTEPRICLMREAWVGEDDASVEREWYGRALSFHRYYWETGTKGDEHDPILQRIGEGEDVPYREFVHNRAFAGTPELVRDEIRRWRDIIGFDEACLIFATAREATDETTYRRATQLFSEAVMPAFA